MFERLKNAWHALRADTVNPLHPRDPGIASLFNFGATTASGKAVTEDSAMNYIAFYSGVKVISEDVASMPLFLMRTTDNGRVKERSLPLFRVLHDEFNPEMSALQGRECMQMHLLLRGNAFAEIVRNGAGQVVQLWPITPTRVTLEREKRPDGTMGGLRYVVSLPDGGFASLRRDQILHIKAISGDGLMGIAPITYLRETIGTALAATEYGARFFANNATPGGVLEHPKQISRETKEDLRKHWEAMHQMSNAHRIAILEEGMKWHEIGVSAEDSQLLDLLKHQRSLIAGALRIPAHKINDLGDASYNNVEHLGLEYVSDILPWFVRWEQQAKMDLLLPSEKERGLVMKHNINALLRADTSARGTFYKTMRESSAFTINDILELEDMNTIGEVGDTRLIPGNMVILHPDGTLTAPMGSGSNQEGMRHFVPDPKPYSNGHAHDA